MKLRFKIYFLIIILLTGFLIYAVFFMKSDFIENDGLPSTIAGTKVKVGDKNIQTYKPDFLPKPIPEAVLKGSKENEFYYYLFFKPERKVIFYQFKEGSSAPENSESFHKQIVSYLGKVLIDGNYKNNYVSERGATLYKKTILADNEAAHYQPKKEDSKKYKEEMLAKKAEIDAVKAFYKECAATMCIINPKTSEYVVIDKRDFNVAKKALEDYKRW